LHRFVSSVSDKCEHLNGAVTYPESSERFFKYVSQLAEATKSYLQRSVRASNKSPSQYLGLRDEIATLRSSWGFMHQFVQPVLEADTLRLPICLLDGLRKRFREMPRFSSTDFIFYHSARLNYFNVKLAEFKTTADPIANLVGGHRFPSRLGLIGIPYSQSSSLFINCLIPHEMGHHVFGDLKLAQKFRSDIDDRLIKRYGTRLDTKKRGTLADTMTFWVEELFCDGLAVRLVGFCFSLAFVELFDIATVLDESGSFEKSRAGKQLFFDQYPPDLFRLRLQASVLKADGWWDKLNAEAGDSQYVAALRAADSLQDREFIYPRGFDPADPAGVRATFTDLVPSVINELNKATGKIQSGATQWENQNDIIEKYLEKGVVPSTLVPENAGEPIAPDQIAILNASYRFYICSLSHLISRIEKANNTRIADCSDWSKRLEMWAAKAVEDVGLLNGHPKFPPAPPEKINKETDAPKSFAVLSKNEIARRLRLPIENEESLVITPLLDLECFDQDSLDLRLGTHFLMPQVPPEPYVDLASRERETQSYLHLNAPLGSYFVLPAHQTVLGATLEFVKLPYDISGEILTKSSVARTFITIETAPWIHPSYRGCLTLEIANVSDTAILLYPGTPIGQLVLFHVGTMRPPRKLSGSNLGPIYPEAPKMKTPREMLEGLGLTKRRRPGHGWIDDGKIGEKIGTRLENMNAAGRRNINAVIKILLENGAFPSDNNIGDIFRSSRERKH
jgi:dCTP deaminase